MPEIPATETSFCLKSMWCRDASVIHWGDFTRALPCPNEIRCIVLELLQPSISVAEPCDVIFINSNSLHLWRCRYWTKSWKRPPTLLYYSYRAGLIIRGPYIQPYIQKSVLLKPSIGPRVLDVFWLINSLGTSGQLLTSTTHKSIEYHTIIPQAKMSRNLQTKS